MRSIIKTLCLFATLLVIFAGSAYATSLEDDLKTTGVTYYFGDQNDPLATLEVHLSGEAGNYTYEYRLTNEAIFNLTSLVLPVVAGEHGAPYEGVGGDLGWMSVYDAGPAIYFLYGHDTPGGFFGLQAGEMAAPIFIDSGLGPDLATAYLSGTSPSNEDVASPQIYQEDLNIEDPPGAPEPSTLLLLGSGILGLGAFRKLRSRKRNI